MFEIKNGGQFLEKLKILATGKHFNLFHGSISNKEAKFYVIGTWSFRRAILYHKMFSKNFIK
jgi:hypothetical protein